MKHVNYKLDFEKDGIQFSGIVRTELPQEREALIGMLAGDAFAGPDGKAMSRKELDAAFVGMATVGGAPAPGDPGWEWLRIPIRTGTGYRLASPCGTVRPVSLVYRGGDEPVVLWLDVDKSLLDSDPKGDGVWKAFGDALEASGVPEEEAARDFYQVFRDHAVEFWTRGLFPKDPKPVAAIGPASRVPSRIGYSKILAIGQDEMDKIEAWLSNEEHLDEDDTFVRTAKFPDGRQMDIKCCGVQDEDGCAWTEAVLFDPDGHEVACTEPAESFDGTWSFEVDGARYEVEVGTLEGMRETLRKEAYRRYQLDWMASHGRSAKELADWIVATAKDMDPEDIMMDAGEIYDDWESDAGFGGSLWACYGEFLGAEYRDPDYMRHLLPDDLYDRWTLLDYPG